MEKERPSIYIEKVPEDSEIVRNKRRYEHGRANQAHRIFAEVALEAYNEEKTLLQTIHDGRASDLNWNIESIERTKDERVEFLKEDIKELLSKDDLRSLTIRGMFIDFSIEAIGQGDFVMCKYMHKDADGKLRISIDEMPNEILVKVVELYVNKMKEKREKAEKNFETWSADFIVSCEKAIDNKWLPLDLSTVTTRVDETKKILTDLTGTGEEYLGGWRRWVLTINSSMENEEDQRNVFFHEMVHTIAGRELIQAKHRYSSDDSFGSKDIQFRNIGLGYEYEYAKGEYFQWDGEVEPSRRFSWLNEGFTEMISMRLQSKTDDGSYQKEREAIQKMIDDGVDEQLFINAYFEDRDNRKPKGERVPALRALLHKIHEVYEPGHLMRIEEKFEEDDKE
ncbi:hypothetical protein KKH43_03040 [Patescibacteria group bacterium]|nr:hypothetical protein [Patescibacteria group bacterium]